MLIRRPPAACFVLQRMCHLRTVRELLRHVVPEDGEEREGKNVDSSGLMRSSVTSAGDASTVRAASFGAAAASAAAGIGPRPDAPIADVERRVPASAEERMARKRAHADRDS